MSVLTTTGRVFVRIRPEYGQNTAKGDLMRINKHDFVEAKVRTSVSPGEALKILRELQGLSQNQLAEMTGINQSNISALENGTKQLGRERALVLAQALRVHPAVLLFPDFDMAKVA